MSTWKDRAIERSQAITDAWEVVKAYAGRVAEWVLFSCMVANIIGILPGVHLWEWFQSLVMGTQVIALDVGGFGLASLADHARQTGNEKTARLAGRTSFFLIALMILTVLLVSVGTLWPSLKSVVDTIDKGLILVRVAMTVIYSHVIHKLRTVQEQAVQAADDSHARAIADLQKHLQQVRDEKARLAADHHRQDELARQEKDALALQLEQAKQAAQLATDLHARTDQAHQNQSGLVADLQNRLHLAVQETQGLTAKLSAAQLQNADLSAQLETANRRLSDLQNADHNLQKLSAKLQSADLQNADLTAKLETAKAQLADLQTANMQTAKPAKPTANNITPIDQARTKHAAPTGDNKPKVSHADVLAYMAANPDLKRAEVAANLGISERKVYDAIAWGKEQEPPAASASSAR